jgi:hypothetical protein
VLRGLQIKWWLFRGKRERVRKNPAKAIKYFALREHEILKQQDRPRAEELEKLINPSI